MTKLTKAELKFIMKYGQLREYSKFSIVLPVTSNCHGGYNIILNKQEVDAFERVIDRYNLTFWCVNPTHAYYSFKD